MTPDPDTDQLERALAAVGVLIRRIEPGQWESPTPCTEWSVHRLVTHLVGMNLVFAAMLVGEPPPDRREFAVTDLPDEYDASAALLVDRFRGPGVLDHVLTGPLGSATGRDRLHIRLYDLLAHGWDLSRAIDQPLQLPDDFAEGSLAFATGQLEGMDRTGRFLPPQPVAESSEALERLAAFLGRDVTWTAQA
jgi:uncharacterized protein (TIGR03086 family)